MRDDRHEDAPDYLVTSTDAENLQCLEETLKVGRPTVAFVGAGLSCFNGYASWPVLVDRLAQSIDVQTPGDTSDPVAYARDLQRVTDEVHTQYLMKYQEVGSSKFLQAVRVSLARDKRSQYHAVHAALLKINFSAFITTNFDPSLEIADRREAIRGCPVLTYEEGVTFSPELYSEGGICHVHGRLWDSEGQEAHGPIVFLKSEYSRAYDPQSGAVAQLLKQVMENRNMVFLGFGMSDPDFNALLQQVTGSVALREFNQRRITPRRAPEIEGAPLWYRLMGLRDDDLKAARAQCEIDHGRLGQGCTIVHYKFSLKGGIREDWGLKALLQDLATHCPQAPNAAQTSVNAEEEASVPLRLRSTAPVSVDRPQPATEGMAGSELEDFNDTLSRVETILDSHSPSLDDIDWVTAKLAEPAVLDFACRFLLTNAEPLRLWFPVLFNARFLSTPPGVVSEGVDPFWHCGPLLVAAASAGFPLLPAALESVTQAGPNASQQLLRAFFAIPDLGTKARLTPAAVRWMDGSRDFSFLVPEIGNAVRSLLGAGYPTEARLLFDALLQRKPDTGGLLGTRVADPKVDGFWLHHIAQNVLPELAKANAKWLADSLEATLRRLSSQELIGQPAYAPPAFLPSPGFQKPVEECGDQHQALADQLVGALRDAMNSLITKETPVAAEVVRRWLTDRSLVFRRLALYLLANHGETLSELRPDAVRHENLLLLDCYPEFWKFLNSQFVFLDTDLRKRIEDWILDL